MEGEARSPVCDSTLSPGRCAGRTRSRGRGVMGRGRGAGQRPLPVRLGLCLSDPSMTLVWSRCRWVWSSVPARHPTPAS